MTAGEHVLVIDDDPAIRSAVTLALSMRGWQVTECTDLGSARAVVGSDEFDLVLLDRRLGSDDGLTLLSTIVAPVLVMSADGDTPQQAADRGAVGYLVKPFDLDDLYVAVDAALAG